MTAPLTRMRWKPKVSPKYKLLSEECNFPGKGKVKKEGPNTTIVFEVPIHLYQFETMDEAKKFFYQHHDRISKVIDRYCDFALQMRGRKRTIVEIPEYGKMVKRVLIRLGFLDED